MPDTFPKHTTSTLAVEQFCEPRLDDLGAGAVLALFGPQRPPLTLAVAVAERIRVALMRACPDRVAWQISGKDGDGRPRVGHDHLFFLPYCSQPDAGPDASIDRVLVWAREGLELDTQSVLTSFAEHGGWIGRGGPRLRVEVLELGPRRSLGQLPRAIAGPARVWRSATPFVPPRYCKPTRDTAVQQLERLAGTLLERAPSVIEGIEGQDGERDWGGFVQRSGSDKPGRPGASGWTLRFDRPVLGPVVLGHDAHYGLGRFEAVLS